MSRPFLETYFEIGSRLDEKSILQKSAKTQESIVNDKRLQNKIALPKFKISKMKIIRNTFRRATSCAALGSYRVFDEVS